MSDGGSVGAGGRSTSPPTCSTTTTTTITTPLYLQSPSQHHPALAGALRCMGALEVSKDSLLDLRKLNEFKSIFPLPFTDCSFELNTLIVRWTVSSVG